MAAGTGSRLAALRHRLPTRQGLRLASGLVLFAYVIEHLVSHAFGLVSLAMMERASDVTLPLWRSDPGTALLVLAALTHAGLALYKVYGRRSPVMPLRDWLQLLSGIAIPFLLVLHVMATRGLAECCGLRPGYAYVLTGLWPDRALLQTLLVLLAWLHGCIGLQSWIRLKSWYPPLAPWLLGLAILVPTLSLLGFAAGAREAVRLPEPRLEALAAEENWPGTAMRSQLVAMERRAQLGFTGLLAGLVLLRGLHEVRVRRRRRIRLTYPDGRELRIEPGMSVLEASRAHGIPHAAVCGGRGRCSTCRIRILASGAPLPEPGEQEARVLQRLGRPADIRLACQLRPAGDLTLAPIVPPLTAMRELRGARDPAEGVEREVVVMFVDLRGFTRLAEGRLPYDVVYLLNQYFRVMGEHIEADGGHVDKFVGDGIMALFGLDRPAAVAAGDALRAAAAMAKSLAALNDNLAHLLAEPLDIAMGLHAGSAIVGEMGYGRARQLTAMGDTVNVASRLEDLAKERGVALVASEAVFSRARLDAGDLARAEVAIRGRDAPLAVRIVPRIDRLEPILDAPAADRQAVPPASPSL